MFFHEYYNIIALNKPHKPHFSEINDSPRESKMKDYFMQAKNKRLLIYRNMI